MMTDILFQVIQMILSMVEVWLCYQLLYSTLLEKEYLNRKEKAVIWVNILLFGAAVSYNRNIIFSPIACSCWAYLSQAYVL